MTPTPPGSNSSPNWCRRCPQIQDTSTGNPAFLTEVSQNSGHLHRILRLNPQSWAVAQVTPSSGAGPPSSRAGAFCWWRRSPFFRRRSALLPEQVHPSSSAGPPAKRSKSVFLLESCSANLSPTLSNGAGPQLFFGPAPDNLGTCARNAGDLRHLAEYSGTVAAVAPLADGLEHGRRTGTWPTGRYS